MLNKEERELQRLLKKGIIESQQEFELYMSFHDDAYYPNANAPSTRTFRIHLEEGLCEITVERSTEQVPKDTLAFPGYYWQEKPIRIHFFDQMNLAYDSYYDLRWAKHTDEAILYNYKLVGRVCTVRQLKEMSLDFLIWTRPAYNREFLHDGKMILNTYVVDGELKVLYVYFRLIEDCDIEQDSIEDLNQIKLEITNTRLVKGGSYEHLIQAS